MRGQFFSVDFVLSSVIFIGVLLLLFPMWNEVNTQIADAEAKKDMQIAAFSAAELLVKSTGSPPDWAPDNVSALGLANSPRVINLTKFEYLRQIDYDSAKVFLGIGFYNFSVNVSDEFGFLATGGIARSPVAYFSAGKEEMKSEIANSGLTWDYYWGHDLPGAEPDHADARNFFDGAKTELLNSLLFNASALGAYRTIILEEPDIEKDDVNNSALTNFLLGGGRLVVEGSGYGGHLLLEGFGANSSAGAAADGVVLETDWLLREHNGSAVSFTNAMWAVHSEEGGAALLVDVADTLNNSRGLVAWWAYGPGRIYYISDLNGSVAGETLAEALNVGGARLEYGKYPENAANVMIANRLVSIEGTGQDGRQFGRLQLVVWA